MVRTYRPRARAKAILDAYVEAWPNATEQEIGERFGVSHQRVAYVLKQAGVRVGHTAQAARAMMREITYCRCGRKKNASARTCRVCRVPARTITLPCNDCGTPVTRSVARIENNRRQTHKTETVLYCNHTCFARWVGTHHGLGARTNATREPI